MSYRKKILLGIATLWPFVYLLFFIALMIIWAAGTIWQALNANRATGPDLTGFYGGPAFLALGVATAALHVMTAVEGLVVFVFYVYHITTNARLTEGQRVSWVMLLISTAALAMPLYFYLHVWREPRPAERKLDKSGVNRGPQ